MQGLTTVILAAGEGKRMRSRQPKVLHELCGRPLISYSLRVARAVSDQIVLVVGRPQGYGRVLRQGGRVKRIVEDRDATDDEKKVGEINTSVYGYDGRRLWSALDQVRPENDQGEYYLTDVIGLLARAGGRIEAVAVEDPEEALGVNDRKQLAALAAIQRRRILDRHMLAGVTIHDPASTYIDDTVTIGADTVIYPNVIIDVASEIGSECVIGAGCQIRATKLADRVQLKPYCVLTESVVERGAVMGPFCHLRPNSHVGENCEIGNFIELKKTKVGRKSKAHHVGYLGDTTIGEGANIGAGTITCNYDGVAKHPTVIGDGAFVGTNSSLVAPLTIGKGAYVAAGSVITKDVPDDALALERSPQVVKKGWAARFFAATSARKPKE